MTAVYTYPGVYLREEQSGSVSISQVATSIALFVGMTQRGAVGRPTRVLTRAEYERIFGADTAVSEMTHQVRQFMLNGGSECFVMRIANGAQSAQVTLDNEFGAPAVILTAREAGLIGETIRIEVDYNTALPEVTFNLTVYREEPDANGRMVRKDLERHPDLEAWAGAPRNVVDVLAAGSRLVDATLAATPLFRGVAFAGLIGKTGTPQTDLESQLNVIVPVAGRFEISVDGQPWVPVALANPITVANIGTAVNAAILPQGVAVTVDSFDPITNASPGPLLRIRSNNTTARSRVLLRSISAADDIARACQMGSLNGGIELGGASAARPMPTGLVARLGSAAGLIDTLYSLLGEARTAVHGPQVADPQGAIAATSMTLMLGAGLNLFDNATNVASLLEGLNTLAAITGSLDLDLGAAPPRRWKASLEGFRMALRNFNVLPDFGPAATITWPGTVFGAAASGQYLSPGGGLPARANVRAYRLGGYGNGVFTYQNGTGSGLDGGVPTPLDYDNAYITVARDVEIFNMLILPRATGQTSAARDALWGPASAFCQSRRAVLLIDGNDQWADHNAAATGVAQLRAGLASDYAAAFWPRITIADPLTGADRQIDPTGSVAGVAARIDTSVGVWRASAGLDASIRGTRGVEHNVSDLENGVFNVQALNGIRSFAGGIVVWGARTMDGYDGSPNTDYRYLPVRRTACMIESSLERGLRFATFRPNDEPLWAQIRLAAGAFMNGIFRRGGFQGARASDAYFVKCDGETTTQTDRNLGICNVVVGFAALRPAEFVVITVRQLAGQIQT